MNTDQYLFSYGTLQLKDVQRVTFGRLVPGQRDSLLGFRIEMLEIRDAEVIAESGERHHPVVVRTGDPKDRVAGTVFAVSLEDLARSDAYEVSDYRRELFALASGLRAWVYVDARLATG
ncbi:MAG TPA: gamma-glutamylcyclotransferase family protein [Burkholderiales bacterium]